MEYALVALWLGAYLALLLAGLPLAATLFPRLADRGVGVAIPLATALFWLVAYVVGQLSLALALVAGVAALVTAAAVPAALRWPTLDRRLVGETAAVFALAFLFLVAVRAVNPAVHPIAGEKFLDYGLLRTILRADALPPEDMWFAGEPVSYYYGGHLLAALLTRLTATPPQYAYNLALAGYYATYVTAAYGLAGSVAAHRGVHRRLGAVLGAVFVGVASNLSTPGKLVVWALPDGVARWLADTLGFELAGLARSPAAFGYWNASRIIPGTINEFPLFAWLNGDLHAHMMSPGFLLLAAAILFAYYRTPEVAVARRRLLVVGTLPPLAGLLAVVNTWSFPTVGGLTALTLLFAPSDARTLLPRPLVARLQRRSRALDEVSRHLTALGGGGLVVALGVLWSAPFWLGTASPRAIAVLPDRSGLGGLLLVHGGFLLVFAPYLLRYALGRLPRARVVGAAVLALAALGLLLDAAAVTLFAPLVAVPWLLARAHDGVTAGDPADDAAATADGGGSTGGGPASRFRSLGFEAVLLVGGAGLLLLVEFVYIAEEAGPGRMNTVFKTYAQVWALWGVAAAVALARLVGDHRPSLPLSGGRWRQGFRALAVVLVLSTSLYGALALSDHFTSQGAYARTEDPTLNATAFVARLHPREAGAIAWIDAREGQPNIVTAPGGYRWIPSEGEGASAPASLTGVPTVLGWHHEIGYRGRGAYLARATDVRRIYTGPPDRVVPLLRQYDVRYVYVGPAERANYGEISVDRVEGVTAVRAWEAVTIYRVNRSALPAA